MALFLECTDGKALHQIYRITDGVRIGRTTGEILLDDPKVSALHAQIESSQKGQLFLVDKDSSNGLKINGKRVQRIALLLGVKLQIGRHFFKVVELSPSQEAGSPVIEVGPPRSWRGVLNIFIPRLAAQNSSRVASIFKFSPLVELEFLRGVQTESKLVLGYGPRKAGSDVLDIELQEPDCPDIAFELLPEEDGLVRFRTNYPEVVLLNEAHISSDLLKAGDQIRIGSTVIEVHFLK